MLREIFLSIVCLLLAKESLAVKLTSVIQTTKGPVQGEILKTIWKDLEYNSFKGIRYAEPPTGNRRFKPPIEAKPWNETFKALDEGNKCPQFDFVTGNYTGDEDCLFLNVYAPQTPGNKPVMVWIHGGSFKSGYKNSDLYGADFFLDEDVLVVTINYRLGALGFLGLDHPDALGNTGLKDQNLALRWVKQNIKNFGGDPNQITIVGQSAGGVSVDMHVLSDKSRGLYDRSISMSSSVFCSWGFMVTSTAVDRAFKLGERLGYKTSNKDDLLQFLRNADVYEIVAHTQNLTLADPPFKPTLENADLGSDETFLTQCAVDKYLSGNYSRLPHLMGFTQDESLAFAKSVAYILDMLDNTLSSVNNIFQYLNPFKDIVNSAIEDLTNAVFDELIKVSTNIIFKSMIDLKQHFMAKTNEHEIYYYDLSYNTEYALHRLLYNIQHNGTAHGDDLGFLFYITAVKGIPVDPEDPFNVFRMKMVRMWSNFIKYGNPTPNGKNDKLLNVVWPDSRKDGHQLFINASLAEVDRQIDWKTNLLEKSKKTSVPSTTGCKSSLWKGIQSILG